MYFRISCEEPYEAFLWANGSVDSFFASAALEIRNTRLHIKTTIRIMDKELNLEWPQICDVSHLISRFSTWLICSREQRKKQLDWLATNTDVITSQSHSLFACSREQIRQVENWLYKPVFHFIISLGPGEVFRQ